MNTGTKPGLSADTQAMMAFESGKKSVGLAYVLWVFLGGVGGHRFYLGMTGSAAAQLALFAFGWILALAGGVGVFLLIALGLWLLIDLFTIPGMAASYNALLMSRLNQAATPAPLDTADELAKFAALKDKGAITADEYEEQKARIMGKPYQARSQEAPVTPAE